MTVQQMLAVVLTPLQQTVLQHLCISLVSVVLIIILFNMIALM